MAISIISSPPTLAGLHAPIWHVVLSDQITQPDFRYVFIIKIGGNTVATLKVLPDDSGLTHGVIDVSKVLRSFIRSYFDLSGATPFIIRTNLHVIEYTIEYAEEYSGAIHITATTSNHKAYNSYAGDTPGAASAEPSAGYPAVHWLTDHPTIDNPLLAPVSFPKHDIRMSRNGNYFISYMNLPPYTVDLYLTEVDEEGIPVTFPDFTLSSTQLVNGLLVLNLNLEFINAAPWDVPTPLSPTAAGYRLFATDGVDTTETIYVRWLCEPKVTATPLHFMNRHGGFDTFYFTGPTRKSLDTKPLAYEKIGMVKDLGITPREYIAATGVFADTHVQYNTQHNWSRKLNSGFVDDATHEWLWQLVASPQVYFEQDGFYYPVRIKTQNWTEKLVRFDKMYNLEIEITMGRNVRSQSR